MDRLKFHHRAGDIRPWRMPRVRKTGMRRSFAQTRFLCSWGLRGTRKRKECRERGTEKHGFLPASQFRVKKKRKVAKRRNCPTYPESCDRKQTTDVQWGNNEEERIGGSNAAPPPGGSVPEI